MLTLKSISLCPQRVKEESNEDEAKNGARKK